jgi:cyclohexyl-isocyanide hydratase
MPMIPHDTHLHIGSLLFEGVDQIDLTGPFEVLSRIPNATYRIYGKTAAPARLPTGERPSDWLVALMQLQQRRR